MWKNRPLSIYDFHAMDEEIEGCSAIEQEQKGSTLILKLSGIVEQKGEDFISTEKISSIIRSLSGISRIIFSIDSPGGSVDGIQDLTGTIKSTRMQGIEFIAIANPLCCSAAYWLACACDKVFLSSSTSRIGSVGVVIMHEDLSKKDEAEGKFVTEIVAGKYKRIDSEHKSLPDDGKILLQGQVDYIYSLFVDEIAINRSIPVEKVISEIGDGRIFIGQQAVVNGIADGIYSLDDIVERKYDMAGTQIVIGAPQNTVPKAEEPNELEQLKKENEELKKKIAEMEQKSNSSVDAKVEMTEEEKKDDEEKKDEIVAQAVKAGLQAERNRVKALRDMAPAACSALLAQAENEGWSVEKAAVEFLKQAKSSKNANPFRSESHVVPNSASVTSDCISEDKERSERAKRIAGYASVRKTR